VSAPLSSQTVRPLPHRERRFFSHRDIPETAPSPHHGRRGDLLPTLAAQSSDGDHRTSYRHVEALIRRRPLLLNRPPAESWEAHKRSCPRRRSAPVGAPRGAARRRPSALRRCARAAAKAGRRTRHRALPGAHRESSRDVTSTSPGTARVSERSGETQSFRPAGAVDCLWRRSVALRPNKSFQLTVTRASFPTT
jgi:hypothetical protein